MYWNQVISIKEERERERERERESIFTRVRGVRVCSHEFTRKSSTSMRSKLLACPACNDGDDW